MASESGKTPDKLLLFSFLAATKKGSELLYAARRLRDQKPWKEILQIVEVLEIAN